MLQNAARYLLNCKIKIGFAYFVANARQVPSHARTHSLSTHEIQDRDLLFAAAYICPKIWGTIAEKKLL